LKAIRLYLEERSCAQKKLGSADDDSMPSPSAPPVGDLEHEAPSGKLSPSAPPEEEGRAPVPVEEVEAVAGPSGQSSNTLTFAMHGSVNAIAESECVICLDVVVGLGLFGIEIFIPVSGMEKYRCHVRYSV